MRRLKYPVEQAVTPEAAFRALVAARGFSGIRAMALAAGITRATVHRALAGHALRRDTAVRIATVLRIDVDDLSRMLRVQDGRPMPSNEGTEALLDAIGGVP